MATGGDHVLAIDQGTTGTTVLLVDTWLAVRGRGYREIPQIYPRPGEVEHDPGAIWESVTGAIGAAFEDAAARGTRVPPADIAAIGITNQRETTLLWERATGASVGNAIVWQDRRTAPACAALKQAGLEPRVRALTGLVLDPYFSATKIRWLLDNTAGLSQRAARGEVVFGTVDSFLVWRLSAGAAHVTDASNASRTLLYDLGAGTFTAELADVFGVPMAMLPEVRGSAEVVAKTRGVPGLPDGIPIAGMAGDQQAALFGQDCLAPGDAKCTFGTGAFVLMNVGATPVVSRSGLLGTVAWTLDGQTSFALEGSAFIAGALVQWLRDGLRIIASAPEIEALARAVPDAGGVVIVPALVGLGAPHWRPDARGIMTGLTRGTTRAHIARAALEAIALQNVELIEAMAADTGRSTADIHMRVDGGAAANDLLMQLQADFLGVPIHRPAMLESTALGAAKLAARGVGLTLAALSPAATVDDLPATGTDTNMGTEAKPPQPKATVFHPTLDAAARAAHLRRWREAVAKA